MKRLALVLAATAAMGILVAGSASADPRPPAATHCSDRITGHGIVIFQLAAAGMTCEHAHQLAEFFKNTSACHVNSIGTACSVSTHSRYHCRSESGKDDVYNGVRHYYGKCTLEGSPYTYARIYWHKV